MMSPQPQLPIGGKFKFDYPQAFRTLPEYTARRGQTVTIVRPLRAGSEYDLEEERGDPMYLIRTEDGWQGQAYESELQPLTEGVTQ